MNKRFLLTVVAVCFSLLLKAQSNVFKDPATFSADVTAMMAVTKAEPSIAAGNAIISYYGSASEPVKKKIFDLSNQMFYKKKFKAIPHFTNFFAAVAFAGAKMSPTDVDSMLYVTQKVLEKYDSKQIGSFFITLKTFFEKDALFISAYNSLYVKGGSYKIKWVEAAPEPSPMDKYDEALSDTAQEEENYFEDLDNPALEEDAWGTLEEEQPADEAPQEESVLDVGYLPPAQPTIEGAVIVFENIDLHFETVNENADIKGTSGALLLKNNLFVGNGGKFDWSCAGYSPEEIYVELKGYNFPVLSTKIYSEGATLSYPAKTDQKVDGVFEYRSVKHKSHEDMIFPRFKSFASNVDVKGLGENVEYQGGIALAGRKIYSSSIDEGYSIIKIKKDGQVRIKSRAAKFELGDSLITSSIANLVIYQGTDSIYHPGVTIKYNQSIPSIRAVKSNSFKYAPFLDSYHKLDITIDGLLWNLNEPQIDFWIFNGKSQISGVFESEKYYQANKYSTMQGMYRFHPLQMIIYYSDTHKRDSIFMADDVAKENKLEPVTVRGAMVHLMKLGFIDYNTRTGLIKLRPKARHYVMSRRDKSDYDNLILYSLQPNGPNATLDMTSNLLTIKGVEKVFLSDSLSVFIVPDSHQVKFMSNRDFEFNGKINTENFQFVGTKFRFDYDSFLVHLPDIREIKVAVSETKDKAKDSKSRVLGNELKYSSGTLFINKPGNKSARKKFPEYPIFDATTGATVFFDKKHINGGAYDTTLKFKIPPFRVDSLSSDDRNAIGFDGEFESGGIFPPFKEKLVVMPDYSLGFKHEVPPDGYQLYDNKGKFYHTLKLDNQGLRGDGEIHYLTTTAWSKDFVFYKDSVNTLGTKVDTKAGKHAETTSPDVTFTDMQIDAYDMKWLPRKDSMIFGNVKEPFHLYAKSATLEGKSIITASGMHGQGILQTRGSESQSLNFHFEQTRYTGRHALFSIKSDNPDKPALLCNDVKLEFELDKGFAYFSPEVEGYASNVFPYLQYKSSLDKGVWDLEKRKITMKMDEGGHIDKSYFYSTRPDQDSLVFNATDATYDMNKQTLLIQGIPYIKVADAKLFIDSNKVVIHENAEMETLHNTKIVIDTINGYHHLYDGVIDIKGRKRFDGVATYQYVNLGDDTLSIKFQNFRLQESLKKKERASTVATGAVTDDDSLYIANSVMYKGKVTMYADNKILFFDGYVKLDLKGALHYSQWMKYVNNGDQDGVVIDLQDPKADNGTPLYTGLHFNNQDSIKFYTTFISQKKHISDRDIFTAKGLLNHNAETGDFKISSPDKLAKKVMAGNVFSYNDSSSLITYSGSFNFLDENSNLSLKTAGNGDADLKVGLYKFNTMQLFTCKAVATPLTVLGVSMKAAVNSMVDTVLPSMSEFERAKLKEENMPYQLAEFIGEKGLADYKQKKTEMGYVPMPIVSKEFAQGIVLTDVNYEWSHQYNAWYSVGRIKVGSIMKEDINKLITGYVEIKKSIKGDVITIYLEPSPRDWYFISYENNRMSIVSSSDEVNAAVAKKSKGELETRDKFFYVNGEVMEKANFVRTFKENYLGITEEAAFEQHEQKTIDVPDYELEKQKEEAEPTEKDNTSPYPYEEKIEYEKKEGTVIEEPELNRDKKVHSVEEKEQLQKDQEKMKNLFR